jgi:hypothetical protein
MAVLLDTLTVLAPPLLTSMHGWPRVRFLPPSRHRGRSRDGHRQGWPGLQEMTPATTRDAHAVAAEALRCNPAPC